MEPSYYFDSAGKVLYVRYSREPTVEEWKESMLAVMVDPRCRPGVNVLLDRRSVGPPTTEFVRGITAFVGVHREKFSRCRWAMLVKDEASYGMARMGQALLDAFGIAFEIFSSQEAAEKWLRSGD